MNIMNWWLTLVNSKPLIVPLAAKICPFSVGLSTWWKECDRGSGGNCIPGGRRECLLLWLLDRNKMTGDFELFRFMSSLIPSTECGRFESLLLKRLLLKNRLLTALEELPILNEWVNVAITANHCYLRSNALYITQIIILLRCPKVFIYVLMFANWAYLQMRFCVN